MSPLTKTIRTHICSATNPTVFPRKLKIAPAALPTIAGNTSTAFPASLLSQSADLSNHFFKAPSRNKARIFSAKYVSLLRTLSRVCLILATCVRRSFRFCESISGLACFSVFKSSNLSLYSEQLRSFSTSSNVLVSLLMRLSISVSFEVLFKSSPCMLCKTLSIPKNSRISRSVYCDASCVLT